MLWIDRKQTKLQTKIYRSSGSQLFYKIVKKKQLKIHLNLQEICSKFANFLQIYRTESCNLITKENVMQLLSRKFCDIFKNSFFIEHLRWLLLAGSICNYSPRRVVWRIPKLLPKAWRIGFMF